jgi:putative oxidoreductase
MKNYISWALRLTVAIILLQTLYFKFTAHPDSVHIFSALGVEPYGRIGLGIVELITAILILIPRTSVYGMLNSLGIITGAIVSHFWVIGVSANGDGGKLFLLAIAVFISSAAYLMFHRNEVSVLITKLRRKKQLA